MCGDCSTHFRKWKEHSSVAETSKDVPNVSVDRSLHAEIQELKLQVAGILKSLSSSSPTECVSNSVSHHSTPISSSTLIDGTNNSDAHLLTGRISSERSVTNINNALSLSNSDQKLSLFLTNIDSEVSESEVRTMVCECVEAPVHDCFKVVKLVSKNVDCSMIDFVSFRVDLNVKWKEKALDAKTWPCGVKFRQFINRAWKPNCISVHV